MSSVLFLAHVKYVLTLSSHSALYYIPLIQAMLEQRSMLDSSTLTTMMMSRVSEKTGLLAEPSARAKISSCNLTRYAIVELLTL